MPFFKIMTMSLVISNAVLAIDELVPLCPMNERYITCGTACERTCADEKPPVCTLQCVQGCFCQSGFIREKAGGPCIPPTQCPKYGAHLLCPTNEIFSNCAPLCPTTCITNPEEPQFCIQVCVQGCKCKKDFVRLIRGSICIPERSCSRIVHKP